MLLTLLKNIKWQAFEGKYKEEHVLTAGKIYNPKLRKCLRMNK
jgi:hypothetical protein